MAETLLQVYADVARHLKLDPTITSFSESDESRDIVEFIYESYRLLRRKLPLNTGYFFKSGTLSLVDSTRLYDLASDAEPQGLYLWRVEDETNDDLYLKYATREYIVKNYPQYDEDTGKPTHFYYEGDQIGFYPIPDGSYTVKYEYNQQITEDTSTTATFLVPDDWLDFIKKYTQYLYEKDNGFGSEQATFGEALDILHSIRMQLWRIQPTYMKPQRLI